MMYQLNVLYNGFDPALDQKIRKAVGKSSASAGSGFGERDIQFEFSAMPAAMAAGKKVAPLVKKVWVQVYDSAGDPKGSKDIK